MLERAGTWFLESGIQETNGGVARYYQSDSRRNAPVSTEITGYAISTLTYLSDVTRSPEYIRAADRAAGYLAGKAWSNESFTFPFEPVSNGDAGYAYFFDCGIIARGLLAAWRATGNQTYFERAQDCGLSMAFDFMADEAMHPILRLPEKQPEPYTAQWSRSPGCYQLKSALAWKELAEISGQSELARAYERMLAFSLDTHESFLPGDDDECRVMDRLHAYAYFLEGLLPAAGKPECAAALADGIERLAFYLRAIERRFVRSDVYAQLLRVRLFADRLGILKLDEAAAEHEATSLAAFQAGDGDARTAGSFWFGRKDGEFMPFANPVSTAFAVQALAMWRERRDGCLETPVLALI